MERTDPIAIVGAGIAGLTAALSLAKAGFRVEIFERTAVLQATGAGVQLSPNALRVLRRLEVIPFLTRTAVQARTVTLRSAGSGRPIAQVPVAASDGTPYLSVHRADLQQALLHALPTDSRVTLRLGRDLRECRNVAGGTQLVFADGTEELRRAVIVADGVGSAAAIGFGMAPATDSGLLAWRLLLRSRSLSSEFSPPSGIEAWLGSRRHAVAYPIKNEEWINLVLICPAKDLPFDKAVTKESAALLPSFRGWDRRLRELIAVAATATAWPLAYVERSRWSAGGAGPMIIGDAAHAMLPFAAQGAAMAIEDGWMAAHSFARAADARGAGALFQQARAERVERARRRTRFHRFVYHLPQPLAAARDAVLAARSQEALRRDLAWLYDWQPPEL